VGSLLSSGFDYKSQGFSVAVTPSEPGATRIGSSSHPHRPHLTRVGSLDGHADIPSYTEQCYPSRGRAVRRCVCSPATARYVLVERSGSVWRWFRRGALAPDAGYSFCMPLLWRLRPWYRQVVMSSRAQTFAEPSGLDIE
jgi:hypothetical protein